MNAPSPTIDIQRNLLNKEISDLRESYWLSVTRAKVYKKSGFEDVAKANAEAAVKAETAIKGFEAELSELK